MASAESAGVAFRSARGQQWLVAIVLVLVGGSAVTSSALRRPADVRTAAGSATVGRSAVDVSPFAAPPLPMDEAELGQHCIGVTARQMQLARLQLQRSDLRPQLRMIYEQRRESAWAFAAVLGLVGGKAGAIEEYRTGTVAIQYALVRPEYADEIVATPPDRVHPDPNEEELWAREQWCEAHYLDPLSR